MADTPLTSEDWLKADTFDAASPLYEVTDRDRALLLMEPTDFEEQLIAVEGLLRRNRSADAQLEAERQEIVDFIRRGSGSAREHAIDESGANFQATVYQGAAHSMAAVGMLAPMYESMFFQGFQGIRRQPFAPPVDPPPSCRPISGADGFWDCHNCYDRKKQELKEQSLVGGIMQLAKAIRLKQYLPKDLHKTIDALFEYRNFMFHNGLEWPTARLEKFNEHIEKRDWRTWFSMARRGDQPWIFYLTGEFIGHCLTVFRTSFDAFGAYSKSEHRRRFHIPAKS